MKKIFLTTMLSALMIVFLPTSVVTISVAYASHNTSESGHSIVRPKPTLGSGEQFLCTLDRRYCYDPQERIQQCIVFDRNGNKVQKVDCKYVYRVHCQGGCGHVVRLR